MNPNSLKNINQKGKHWKVKDSSKMGRGQLGKKRPDISKLLKGNKFAKINVGEKNGMWKENPKYRSMHKWVERKLGKPNYCENCRNGKLRHRQYHWANISGEYLRELTDWIRLCVKCHKALDAGKISIY